MKWTGLAGLVLGLFYAVSVSLQAAELTENLSFNGFYGIDATYSDADLLPPASGSAITRYDDNAASLRASIFGGQLDIRPVEDWSVTVQGSTYFNADQELTSSLDWAYISHDLGSDTTIRAGKFQIPILQGVELKRIGFSRLWARPLVPNNGAGGFMYYRGAELLKHVVQGDGHWDFQLGMGRPRHDLDGSVNGKNLQVASARYSLDNHWVRASVMRGEYGVVTPEGRDLLDSGEVWAANIEGEAIIGNTVLNAGYSDTRTDVIPTDSLAYLSLGYRLESVTPFVLITHRNQDFPAVTPPPSGPGGAPPPGGVPRLPPPNGEGDFSSLALGSRWFVQDNLSVKVQLEHHWESDKTRENQGIVRREEGNTFSVLLEGVF